MVLAVSGHGAFSSASRFDKWDNIHLMVTMHKMQSPLPYLYINVENSKNQQEDKMEDVRPKVSSAEKNNHVNQNPYLACFGGRIMDTCTIRKMATVAEYKLQ